MLPTADTQARANSLIQEIDDWRRRAPGHIHNFGLDKLDYLQQTRAPHIEYGEGALFLLVPRHDFHDIIFFVETIEHLPCALSALVHKLGTEKKYRITLNYKQSDPESENDLVRAVFQAGFVRRQRITRIRFNLAPGASEERSQQLLSLTAGIPFAAEFAVPGDEEEILALLREEFDPCADNLPELDEIRQNIENRQVVIIRHQEEIIAANYFTIKNAVYYSVYNITRKDFRGKSLFRKIELFIDDWFRKNNFHLTRSHGWRDITKKHFQHGDAQRGTVWENIFIDYLIWKQ